MSMGLFDIFKKKKKEPESPKKEKAAIPKDAPKKSPEKKS